MSLLAGLALLLAFVASGRVVQTFAPITQPKAQRLMEVQAGYGELAPLTGGDDRLVGGDGALWAWHQSSLAAASTALAKPVWPQLTRGDRIKGLCLLIAFGLCIAQPQAALRALNFDLSPLMGDSQLVMDVWAQPPSYTGLPAVRLNRETRHYSLPQGTIIMARMDGARGAPTLRVGHRSTAMTRARGGAWSAQLPLMSDANVRLNRFGTRAQWQVSLITDKAPRFDGPASIKTDSRGRLDIAFSAQDDYGVTAAFVRLTPIKTPIGLVGHDRFEIPLDLTDGAEATDGEGARQFFVDVAQHALAGLDVSAQIVVRDALGQEALAPPVTLPLPSPAFTNSLATALQEQRLLILREARPYQVPRPALPSLFDPDQNMPIKLDLTEALAGAPVGMVRAHALLRATLSAMRETGLSDLGVLSLHYALERLSIARAVADAHAVAPLLWELALQAEASDKTPAQQQIAQARQALEQALRGGADADQIERLNEDLRAAIGERLNELSQQGAESGDGQGEGAGAGGNAISQDDIDEKLNALEQSGTSGARQDALDQLDQLSELMDNLQSGSSGGGTSDNAGESANSAASSLDDLMQEQRKLSDDTQARQDNPQDQSSTASDLAARQNALAAQMARRGKASDPIPTEGPEAQMEASKAQAAQSMREAAQALQQGDLSSARAAQRQAEQALQELAQAQNAIAGGNDNQDPLGRPSQGIDDGDQTKVPTRDTRQRARAIRDELRRRQSDPNRPPDERNYLDRLLKDP
ncbi:MAG: hypothetical protein RLZZ157_1572 [Pseudomonadota bacterium]|jgi:hypothetical protein